MTVTDVNGNVTEQDWTIDPAPPENHASQTQFAAYVWRDDDGDGTIDDSELTGDGDVVDADHGFVEVVSGEETGHSSLARITIARPTTE